MCKGWDTRRVDSTLHNVFFLKIVEIKLGSVIYYAYLYSMKVLDIDYAEGVIEHEAVILGENLFWSNAHKYPQIDLELAVTKKLIKCN